MMNHTSITCTTFPRVHGTTHNGSPRVSTSVNQSCRCTATDPSGCIVLEAASPPGVVARVERVAPLGVPWSAFSSAPEPELSGEDEEVEGLRGSDPAAAMSRSRPVRPCGRGTTGTVTV
eukprot:scaffold495_cov405-Prasinococcus_capsulatus_cf.AAC.13